MSPASKSKSKDKKVVKETPKASPLKPSGSANANNGISASAYDPLLGTFHTLETVQPLSTSALQSNGRFRNIDETDEHIGAPLGAGVEYDCVSNNGSWSGDSEEHKEKPSNPALRPETVPGADSEKREKIRQKNERKHQRQKERRAQELHERCTGYLMSRKLESLAQQLVSMGFSQERSTQALILNEGKVEESVSWLFEGAEDADEQRRPSLGGGNLKIDISDELARIADMELRYSCTKQEVERAVVSAEGDVDKAVNILRELKQDPPSAPPKPEETGDPPTLVNGGKPLVVLGSQNSAVRLLPKPMPSSILLQRKDDKEFNYTKGAVTVGLSSSSSSESVNKGGVQPSKRIQPKVDWTKSQQTSLIADKRWSGAGSTNPSVSYSVASPMQVPTPPAKAESRYVAIGGEFKNLQQQPQPQPQPSVREPIIMMQRSQSLNMKQIPAASMSSTPQGTSSNWYPTNNVEMMKSNGYTPHIPNARSSSPNNLSSNPMYHQLHYYPQQNYTPVGSPGESPSPARGNIMWSRTNSSPTLAAASSLGLFSGYGSNGTSSASSPVDWTTGGSKGYSLDYTHIDWSLDRNSISSRPNGSWPGSTSTMTNNHLYDSNITRLGVNPAMRHASMNSNGVTLAGFQDGGGGGVGGGAAVVGESSGGVGSREWTSPFEGKDLFSVPRQFVYSPSL